jgi:hypothetical protein
VGWRHLIFLRRLGRVRNEELDGWEHGPVVAGRDEAGAFLVALGVLGGFNDELEGVVHWESKRGLIRLRGFYTSPKGLCGMRQSRL